MNELRVVPCLMRYHKWHLQAVTAWSVSTFCRSTTTRSSSINFIVFFFFQLPRHPAVRVLFCVFGERGVGEAPSALEVRNTGESRPQWCIFVNALFRGNLHVIFRNHKNAQNSHAVLCTTLLVLTRQCQEGGPRFCSTLSFCHCAT